MRKRLAEKEMTVGEFFGDKIDFQYYYRHPRSYARRGVYSIDEPSATIRGVDRPIPPDYTVHRGDKADPHTEDVRVLTSHQRARIQTFPEDFEFTGIKSIDQILTGNAVPVKMASFVASSIKNYDNDKHVCSYVCKQPMLPDKPLTGSNQTVLSDF